MVEAVADPKAALEAIARLSPQVVVVGVPEQGGAALVRTIRGAAAGQAYIVAVLDGTGGGRDISPILAAGATDFLRRPVVEAELVERVLAPKRLIKWANAVTRPAVFDLSSPVDVTRWRAKTTRSASASSPRSANARTSKSPVRTFAREWL